MRCFRLSYSESADTRYSSIRRPDARPVKLPVVVSAPGIFTTTESGSGQAAILDQDSAVTRRRVPPVIAGATQLNVQVPQTAPAGAAIPITIYAAGYISQLAQSVTMAVQ